MYVAQKNSDHCKTGKRAERIYKAMAGAGETKTVSFEFDKRAFAYWNTEIHDWYVPSDSYLHSDWQIRK